MESTPVRSGYHTQFKSFLGEQISQISLHVRKKMFSRFMAHFPDPLRVLDVGVTSDTVAPEANYFEELFPYKDRITAAGVESAQHLTTKYPGLKFVEIKAGEALPFKADDFSVTFSNAVIEHIVEDNERLRFLQELLRVSPAAFITTPNRFFPVEPHTGTPLLHVFFPKTFYRWLDQGKLSKFYNSENLKLLTRSDLESLAKSTGFSYEIEPVRFCGFISNWILILRR